MKAILAFLPLLVGCGAPAPQPIIERNVEGARVFERQGGRPDELVVQDAIEWRGAFAVESRCLVVTVDDRRFTPIFLNGTALRTALGDVGGPGRRGANSWSLEGSRVSESERGGYAGAIGDCGAPPFLVSGLTDPRPLPTRH